MRAIVVVLTLVIGVAPVVRGQAPGAVDPTLQAVVTAGYWEQGQERGQYRILVFSAGYEHIISQVFVQWIRDPQSSEVAAAVINSRPVAAINDQPTWSVGKPMFQAQGAHGTAVALEMTNTHSDESAKRTCILQLGLPGKLSTTCHPA